MRTSTLFIVGLLLAMCLVVVLGATQRCKGKPPTPKCDGVKDHGNNSKRKCKKNANGAMWHYNGLNKTCTQMDYKGCAGNANRWCNKQACETACRR
ncbi:kunitz-type serine protease inhibitor textilinin-5 [Drosophila obscura]|uniref:kunitz-type serine protease inhibitor textilinin-5 n=1 Tax=Drosophila obscura TaxID=7282 RepID=UPI000BA1463E|nr:kunitz-type serine protease inhibitor textilinin-5 [Drosophila obscura]